jgi:hypothetical protein
MIPVAPMHMIVQSTPSSLHQDVHFLALEKNPTQTLTVIPDVPFYSQFNDITSVKWKKIGCGVASLAMVIEYYKPSSVSVDKLLGQAIASGAYQKSAGWTHQGLATLSQRYGFTGNTYDLSQLERMLRLVNLKIS